MADFVQIPTDYGWVVLVGGLIFFLNFFQMFMIGRFRRKYNVPFPKMYSEEHEEFNCAQRAHQNTLEFMPFFLTNLAFGGLMYPVWAAAFGVVFIAGRLIYSIGYYTGKPPMRMPGFIITIFGGILPLIALSIASAGNILGWWD